MKIINLFLKVRYLLFKKWVTKIDFSGRELVFEDNLKTLDNFNIMDGVFYNDHNIWFSKDAVQLVEDGVVIKCTKDIQTRTLNGDTRNCLWTSGMLDTSKTFTHPMGVWVVTAKICDSWPAIWLLKPDRNEPGFTRTQITPEIDIMEVIKGKVEQTIHYGYDNTVYRTDHKSNSPCWNDNKFHEFAVELVTSGYDFYIDGVLTTIYRSSDPDFVTKYDNFLILNNAALENSKQDNYDFVIKSIKVYK